MSKKKANNKKEPGNQKIPYSQKSNIKDRHPKYSQNPDSIINKNPIWKFRLLDLEFPWGFSRHGGKSDFDEVVKKLKNFENLTWAEIDRDKKGNHSIPIEKMSKEARSRLEELKIDASDQETLYQLRITQMGRLYGIREGGKFYIIWWDPEHKANPSKKPNT